MELSLLAAAVLAWGALVVVLRIGDREGRAGEAGEILLGAAVAGLVAGRLAAMIIAGTNPLASPRDVIIVRGGVDTAWAAVGALATFAVLARKRLGVLADAAAAACLAGLAGWHAGCVFTDSCLGTPSDLPWAVALPGSDITRHPVEIYAAVLLALGTGAVLWWRRRAPPPGTIGAVAVAVAAGARLLTEPPRLDLGGAPGAIYAAGLIAGAATAVVLARRDPPTRPATPDSPL